MQIRATAVVSTLIVTLMPILATAQTFQFRKSFRFNTSELRVYLRLDSRDDTGSKLDLVNKAMKGDMSNATRLSGRQSAIQKQSIELPLSPSTETILNIQALGMVRTVEADHDEVVIDVYDDLKRPSDPNPSIRLEQNGSQMSVVVTPQHPLCMIQLEGGRATGIVGQCVDVTVYARPDHQLKVYQNGIFVGKTASAKIALADIAAAYKNGSTDEGLSLLQAYVAEPNRKVTINDMILILENISSDSAKDQAFRTVQPILSSPVAAAQVARLLGTFSFENGRISVLTAVAPKLTNLTADELNLIKEQFSFDSSKKKVIDLLGSRTAMSTRDILRAVRDASFENEKLKILRQFAPSIQSLTASEVGEFLGELSFDNGKLDAFGQLTPKVPREQRRSLKSVIDSAFSFDSSKKKALEILLD